jgi:hypothetical protein
MDPNEETLYVVRVHAVEYGEAVSYCLGPYGREGAERAAAEYPRGVNIGSGVEVLPLYPPDPMDLAFVQPDHPRAVKTVAGS